MKYENESLSYLFGAFCAIIGEYDREEKVYLWEIEEDWAACIFDLFPINPSNTLQFLEERLKVFPWKTLGQTEIAFVNEVISLYHALDFPLLYSTDLEREEFFMGFREGKENYLQIRKDYAILKRADVLH